MKFIVFILSCCLVSISCNPFAPSQYNSSDEGYKLLGDQRTVDGVFQNFAFAYASQDTNYYGPLIDANFTFIYPDYDYHNGAEVTWGRYEEMQTEYGLFQNAQRLVLIWNSITEQSFNTDSTIANISRGFNLTVTLNPNDIIRVYGYAKFQLGRQQSQDPWMITSWYDGSDH
jgi:hypothetical protein